MSIDNRKFLLFYPFFLVLLFGIFYWDEKLWNISYIGELIDSFQRDLLMKALSLLIGEDKINGFNIIVNPHYRLIITPACNGLVPYFIYLAGVLAYNKSILKKILWAIIGYIVIFIVNALRIWIVYLFVLNGRENFHLSHDIIGNILLLATGLLLFKSYIKS